MRPWLLDLPIPGLGALRVSAYFAFLVLGAVLGIELSIRAAKERGEDPRALLRAGLLLLAAGLVGARIGHALLVAPGPTWENPVRVLEFWRGGLVFYGGLAGAAAAALAWCRRTGRSLAGLGDLLAPGLMLGLALGRLGCFSAGCCYGRPIDWGSGVEWPWGVVFLGGQVPSALRGIPLHPTQLYAAADAALLAWFLRRIQRRQRFEGQVLGAMAVLYGLLRSVEELFRLDLERGFLLPSVLGEAISTSQAISIPLVAGGAWLLLRGRARARHDRPPVTSGTE